MTLGTLPGVEGITCSLHVIGTDITSEGTDCPESPANVSQALDILGIVLCSA